MNNFLKYLAIVALLCVSRGAGCQVDSIRPAAPVLKFLTVQPSTGLPELEWIKSISPDVAGYIIYYNANGEGHAFDTVYNPGATSYINHGSSALYLVESYVVAAIDTAGNVSPLSNALNTILPVIKADSCNARLGITWNPYPSEPVNLSGYTVLVKENGGTQYEAGHTASGTLSFNLDGIKPAVNYCITIRADLDGGLQSFSPEKCRSMQVEKSPDWLNAEWVTLNGNSQMSLSFTIDPASELKTYWIKRIRLSDMDSVIFTDAVTNNFNISYTDKTADSLTRYEYRLLAINRCGIALKSSNPADNIVLEMNEKDFKINLLWNNYRTWAVGVSGYGIYMDTGSGFSQISILQAPDTAAIIDYHDIMNEVAGPSVCFFIEATENPDLYGNTAKSRSNIVCMTNVEKITVPTAFTPNNDNLNDLFRPVLSFMPAEYHLIITDRQNNRVFETTDYMSAWDGTASGSPLPADVYLWYLKVKTPSGKSISRTGTVAIVKTR